MSEKLTDHFTLTDKTITFIEKAIFSGSIKSGERIVETEIANRLGISKAPVREAMKKMEGDGIVKLLPRSGYIVKPITLKSTQDFFDIRFLLEPTVVKAALGKKNHTTSQEIDRIIGGMKHSLEKEDYDSYLNLDNEFHTFFYMTLENEWFVRIFQMLQKQEKMLRALALFTKNRFASSVPEHMAIAEAYQEGNAKLLLRAMRFHLEMFKKTLLKSEFFKQKKTESYKG